MSLISAFTGAPSEIKTQPCSFVWTDGGTTLHPCTPFERVVHETRTPQQLGTIADQWSHCVLKSAKSLCNSLFPVQNMVNFEGVYM